MNIFWGLGFLFSYFHFAYSFFLLYFRILFYAYVMTRQKVIGCMLGFVTRIF